MTSHTILYITKTSTGAKCEYREYLEGTGSLFVKGYRRYFYGETPVADACEYAQRKASKYEDYEVEAGHLVDCDTQLD